jgi:tetratricopeptide (TPR) repeat protein
MNSPSLERLLAHDLPEPIADAAVAFFAEFNRIEVDWFRAFHRLIDAFEATVAYAAVLSAVAYARGSVRAVDATQAIEVLRDREELSTGHWWYLLKASSGGAERRTTGEFVDGLAGLAFAASGEAADHAKLLDSIPGLRNRMRGHTFVLPAARYEDETRTHAPVLERTLVGLSRLATTPLVHVLAARADGPGALAEVELRMGSTFRSARQLVRLDTVPCVGDVGVVGAANSEARRWMSLHPFIVHREIGGEQPLRELGVYQGRMQSTATYAWVRSGGSSRIAGHGDAAIQALALRRPLPEAVAALRSPDGQLRVSEVLDAAALVTTKFIEQARLERTYVPEAYVDRARVRAHVEAWLAGPAKVMLLAGASGVGKSSFLCRIAEAHQAEAPQDIVLLVAAARLPAAKGPLADELKRFLSLKAPSLKEGLARWRSLGWGETRPGQVLLLVDGIDRAEDPAELMHALLDVAARTEIRILVAIALPVFDGLAAHSGLLESPLLHRGDPNVLGGVATLVGHLQPDEIAAAYTRYQALQGTSPLTRFDELSSNLRAACANPLLLRTTCEVFDRREISVDVGEVGVLMEHARMTVFADPGRQDLTLRIVRRLAATGSRRLALREALADVHLRAAILAPDGPFKALLATQVLVQHQGRSAKLGLAPESYVEFVFDAMLGYLLVIDTLEQPDARLEEVVIGFARQAATFGPAAVALDLLLRSAPDGEQARMLEVLLCEGPSTSISAAVARFLVWIDLSSPATLSAAIDALVAEEAGLAAWGLDEQLELELERLLGVRTPDATETRPSRALEAMEVVARARSVPQERLVDVLEALRRNHQGKLAGALAHALLRVASDELPAIRRRQAELVLAAALMAAPSDRARRVAIALCQRIERDARAARHWGHVFEALELQTEGWGLIDMPQERVTACERLLALDLETSPHRVLALSRRAHAAWDVDDRDRALRLRNEAEALARDLADARTRRIVVELESLSDGDDPHEDEQRQRRRLAAVEASGELHLEPSIRSHLAWALAAQRKTDEAERQARSARALARTLGLADAEDDAIDALSYIASTRGRTQEAFQLVSTLARLRKSHGQLGALAYALGNMAVDMQDSLAIGSIEAATALLEASRHIMTVLRRRGLDMARAQGWIDRLLAEIYLKCGCLDAALAHVDEAILLARQPLEQARGRATKASILVAQGAPTEALACIDTAATLVDASSAVDDAECVSLTRVEVLHALGRNEEALAILAEVEATAVVSVDAWDAHDFHVAQATSLLALGRAREARAAAAAAVTVHASKPDRVGGFVSSFMMSRALGAEAEISTSQQRAHLFKEAARHLKRAGEHLEREAAHVGMRRMQLKFLRNNRDARALREALGSAAMDDAEAAEMASQNE